MSSWFARNFDRLWAVGGQFVTDARQRVLEEAYFSKIVTPRVSSITIGSGEKSPAQGLGWYDQNFAVDPAHTPAAPERDIHGNEYSIER